jgi:hypothetical protein
MQTIRIATTSTHTASFSSYASAATRRPQARDRSVHDPSQRACPALHSPKLTVIQSLLLQSKPAHRDPSPRIDSCAAGTAAILHSHLALSVGDASLPRIYASLLPAAILLPAGNTPQRAAGPIGYRPNRRARPVRPQTRLENTASCS